MVKIKNKKELTKDLVRVIKRLSINSTLVNHRCKNFEELKRKIEKRKTSIINQFLFRKQDKEFLSEYLELCFYEGKKMAYYYVLTQMVGEKRANLLLLSGIEGDKKIDKYGNIK